MHHRVKTIEASANKETNLIEESCGGIANIANISTLDIRMPLSIHRTLSK
jgi:hypothetical protein